MPLISFSKELPPFCFLRVHTCVFVIAPSTSTFDASSLSNQHKQGIEMGVAFRFSLLVRVPTISFHSFSHDTQHLESRKYIKQVISRGFKVNTKSIKNATGDDINQAQLDVRSNLDSMLGGQVGGESMAEKAMMLTRGSASSAGLGPKPLGLQ